MEYNTKPKKHFLHPTSLMDFSLTPENYFIPSKGNLFLNKSQNFNPSCINWVLPNTDPTNCINAEGFLENINFKMFPERCFDTVEANENGFLPNCNAYNSTLTGPNNDNTLFPGFQKRASARNLSHLASSITHISPTSSITHISPASMNFQNQCRSESAKLLNEGSNENGEYGYQSEDNRETHKMIQEIGESKDAEKPKIRKGGWSEHEDRELKRLVEVHGTKRWSLVGSKMKGRLGKQCRERWNNHLKPGIKKDAWSEEEDIMLIEAHKKLGNHWSKIARQLPGRSENDIKNHWNAAKRRQRSKKKPNDPLMDYIKSLDSAGGSDNNANAKKNSTADDMSIILNAICLMYDLAFSMPSTGRLGGENNLNSSQMPIPAGVHGHKEQEQGKKEHQFFKTSPGGFKFK